jgi:hypothetical protein
MGAERIKGYSDAQILGQHFSCFYTDEDRAAGAPDLILATAAREGRVERHKPYRLPNLAKALRA